MSMVETGTPGRLYFAEWSPPPGVDYTDPQWWPYANPALGTSIDAETLADEFAAPNRNAFLRASLNLVDPVGGLMVGGWRRGIAPRPASSPIRRAASSACEVAMGGDRFYAMRCWTRDGIAYVAPLVVTEYEDDLWIGHRRRLRRPRSRAAPADAAAASATGLAQGRPPSASRNSLAPCRSCGRCWPPVRSATTAAR